MKPLVGQHSPDWRALGLEHALQNPYDLALTARRPSFQHVYRQLPLSNAVFSLLEGDRNLAVLGLHVTSTDSCRFDCKLQMTNGLLTRGMYPKRHFCLD